MTAQRIVIVAAVANNGVHSYCTACGARAEICALEI